MSIGFRFTTSPCDRDKAYGILQELAEERACLFAFHEDHARVGICRTGDLFLTYRDGRLTGDCQTNVAGPGFHVAAVELVAALALKAGLTLEVEDETEYWERRDFKRMRREHFDKWLETMVDVLEKEMEKQYTSLCVCWDMNQYIPQDVPGTIAAPLGRFHVETLKKHIGQQGVEAVAREFFLWYNEEKDGLYYRNNALALLWEDCCFMPSKRSEEDEAVNSRILSLLEQAVELEPGIPVPVEEYKLLCKLHGHAGIATDKLTVYQSDYPVGFRRAVVSHRLGNLTVQVPGSYLYEQQQDGRDHVYYDGLEMDWHGVRISAFGSEQEQDEFTADLFAGAEGEPETFTIGDGRCRAAFAGKVQDEDGDSYYQVIAQVLSGTQVTLLTLSFQLESGYAWAMSLLHSMKVKIPKK